MLPLEVLLFPSMEDLYDKRLPSFRLDLDAAFNQYVESFGWGGVSELARRIGKVRNL
ncbi:MAG TPA: hypothetical protein VGW09_01475 [Nitrososphaeraceae archaeon]|nr:hypothetical protein [Nitrososphaeraceae archaeon]